MKRLIVVALLACGGNPPGGSGGATGTTGGGGGSAPTSTACDGLRGKIEQLYRAETRAETKGDPKRVDEVVADNTTMVMNDCVKAPGKVAACVSEATTVRELEARCLIPIDDEGSEGDQFAR